jgi:hypothetical protein
VWNTHMGTRLTAQNVLYYEYGQGGPLMFSNLGDLVFLPKVAPCAPRPAHVRARTPRQRHTREAPRTLLGHVACLSHSGSCVHSRFSAVPFKISWPEFLEGRAHFDTLAQWLVPRIILVVDLSEGGGS